MFHLGIYILWYLEEASYELYLLFRLQKPYYHWGMELAISFKDYKSATTFTLLDAFGPKKNFSASLSLS